MKTQYALFLIIFFHIFPLFMCQRTVLDSPRNVRLLRVLKGFSIRINSGRSKIVPKSIHKLRPGDIDVIAAMGDSLTSGFGIRASSFAALFVENRGSSPFGGGQGTWRDTLTLPNIIKEFNPNLVGYALGDAWTHNPASQFNVAESGSFPRDMPFMARSLINRIVNDPRVDINKHWKLITFFIGAFDFCNDICWDDPPRVSLDHQKADIGETRRILKKNLPRTLITLVPPPHLKTLVETTGKLKLCALTTNFNCPCLLGLAWRWLSIDEDIGTYSEFQTEEFAVVVQPFTTDIKLPRLANGITDYRYLSADCFHLSPLGNARTAFSLGTSRSMTLDILRALRWKDRILALCITAMIVGKILHIVR